jgi:biotin operon repressor
VNNTRSLFETAEDRAVERCYGVLRGEVLPQATARQIGLLRVVVERRGVARAISVKKLAEMLNTSDREIRSDVHELREVYGLRIGSSRDQDNGGHYLITNKEELYATVTPYLRQAATEMRLVRAMCDPHELAELEGQLRLNDAPKEAANA